jgi:hypothetical protein
MEANLCVGDLLEGLLSDFRSCMDLLVVWSVEGLVVFVDELLFHVREARVHNLKRKTMGKTNSLRYLVLFVSDSRDSVMAQFSISIVLKCKGLACSRPLPHLCSHV